MALLEEDLSSVKHLQTNRQGVYFMASKKVRVAIIGVGNCASSLVQGVQYYRNAQRIPTRSPA